MNVLGPLFLKWALRFISGLLIVVALLGVLLIIKAFNVFESTDLIMALIASGTVTVLALVVAIAVFALTMTDIFAKEKCG